MATFEVSLPDGRAFEIDAPDERTAMAAFRAKMGAPPAARTPAPGTGVGSDEASQKAALRTQTGENAKGNQHDPSWVEGALALAGRRAPPELDTTAKEERRLTPAQAIANPNAYLALREGMEARAAGMRPPPPSLARASLTALGEGLSSNLVDEGSAAINAGVDWLTGQNPDVRDAWNRRYESAKRQREANEAVYPTASTLSHLAGAVGSGLALPGIGTGVKGAAATGAAYGGLAGAGAGEGAWDRAAKAVAGATLGLPLGAAGGALAAKAASRPPAPAAVPGALKADLTTAAIDTFKDMIGATKNPGTERSLRDILTTSSRIVGVAIDPLTTLSAVAGGAVLKGIVQAPASASSAARWARMYENFVVKPTAATAASLKVASKNLSSTLASQSGIDVAAEDLMRELAPVVASVGTKAGNAARMVAEDAENAMNAPPPPAMSYQPENFLNPVYRPGPTLRDPRWRAPAPGPLGPWIAGGIG